METERTARSYQLTVISSIQHWKKIQLWASSKVQPILANLTLFSTTITWSHELEQSQIMDILEYVANYDQCHKNQKKKKTLKFCFLKDYERMPSDHNFIESFRVYDKVKGLKSLNRKIIQQQETLGFCISKLLDICILVFPCNWIFLESGVQFHKFQYSSCLDTIFGLGQTV